RREIARAIRSRGYTCCFVLPNSFKSALIPWLARIPRRIGYGGEARRPLLTETRRHARKTLRRLLDAGYAVWLLGSPNDQAAAMPIATALAGVRDLTGRTDLGTAIDLLSLAATVVSNDSGLMHAAAALGRPLVALFGSSSPTYTPPLSPLAHVAKNDIACSPCFKRECPLGHFKCMRELSVEVVYGLARNAST